MQDKAPWEIPGNENMNTYEIAMTGKAFQIMIDALEDPKESPLLKDIYKRAILHGKIYARMSPDHKAILVNQLQNASRYMIGMCGDGANDCKALKTADIGLSLSEAEASIAAPFTSKIPNISPIIKLLQEGRTSIVT